MSNVEQSEAVFRETLRALADDLRPFVQDIESSPATTRGNYGTYAAVLRKSDDPLRMKMLALALIQAGASRQGVLDALNLIEKGLL